MKEFEMKDFGKTKLPWITNRALESWNLCEPV